MAKWLNQKPQIATEKDLHGNWNGGKDGKYFRCYLCGYKFKLNDYWRFVYCGDKGYTNFKTCEKCDDKNVIDKWIEMHKIANEKFWYFTMYEDNY